MERDSSTKSSWQTLDVPTLPPSSANLDEVFDVAIIGGGITGTTTALLLQEAGKKSILLEARSLGFGTTSGTTAHLNTYIDTYWHVLEKKFGKDGARLTANAVKEAVTLAHELADRHDIVCDFMFRDGFVFSSTPEESAQLDEMAEAAGRAGIPVNFSPEIPFPAPFKKCLVFPRQAQFHPMKYLYGLAGRFLEAGGAILENHRVTDIKGQDNYYFLQTAAAPVRARRVVYATHLPPGVNLLHFYCAPYRSYVLGLQLENGDEYPGSLLYDMQEPYHYIRTQHIEGKNYLMLGGADHKTGEPADPRNPFEQLEDYARKLFRVKSVDFRWSSQYYVPADGLPYIGHLPGKIGPVYVATGFGGNGITFGSLAAKILSDLIVRGSSPYEDLFRPGRVKPVAGFKNFVKENSQVIKHFIADRIVPAELESLAELAPGEAMITNYKDRKLAVYRDPAGEIRALDPVCPHAKCFVQWNKAENSWDCPCHGSRFSPDGRVLTGPAVSELNRF